MKTGEIVKGNRHEHRMTVRSTDGNKVTVNYFIKGELKEETYNEGDLTMST